MERLRGIPLFYENQRRTPIDLISDQIYNHIKTTHEVPNRLIVQRHYMATHSMNTLDKTYKRFIRLIETRSEPESKLEWLEYIEGKDTALKKRLSKYILEDDVLTRMNDEQITR